MMRCFRIERRVPSEAETSTMLSRALDRRSMAEAAAATRLQWRGQERLQHLLCLGHAPFADLQMSDMTDAIDKVHRGPIPIVVRAPRCLLVVDCDWIRHVQIDQRLPYLEL